MVYQSGKVFTNKIHKIQIVINIKYTTQVHQKKKKKKKMLKEKKCANTD